MKKSRMFRKSIVAAIAALCLTAPMAMMPMTASAYTITVQKESETSTLSYDAYQIFSGVYSNGVLGSIQWGSGIDSTKTENLLNAIKAIEDGDNAPFAGCNDAEDVALKLGEYTTHDATAVKAFAKVVAGYLSETKIAGTNGVIDVGGDVGYYLVQNSGTVSGNASATRNILKVVGEDVTVSIKTAVPTIEKKVQENTNITDDYDAEKYPDYNDVADYNIGDDVPFLDIGTLPSDIDEYDEYYYQIVDTPGDKFTPNIDDIVVKINGKEVYVDGDNVKVEYVDTDDADNEPDTIKVTFEDIKDVYEVGEGENKGDPIIVDKDSKVTVEYTAKLDKDADIGLDGQTSEVKLNFSNDPNEEYNPSGSNDAEDKPQGIGTTPPDKVIVFTYELDITKYLDEAKEENLAKSGVAFKIYRTVERMVGGEKTEVVQVATLEGNVITGWEDDNGTAGNAVTVDSSGKIIFKGLDDGTYKLKETLTPAGYNSAELTVKIDATTVNDQKWSGDCEPEKALTKLTVDNGGTADLESGVANINVVNQRGSSLPSTGGIGTTIFYLGGGSMAAVAGIYLITKKRMKNSEEE